MAGAAGCMKYDGDIYRNFTYQEALHIDKNDWKALKMTCGGRQKRCPEFRFCRDKYDLARQHFVHSNIDAGATRRFRYDVGGGWRADVVVADVIGGAEGDDDAVDKSDLLGTLGLLHVGADRVFGQLPPLEETSSGVSVGCSSSSAASTRGGVGVVRNRKTRRSRPTARGDHCGNSYNW